MLIALSTIFLSHQGFIPSTIKLLKESGEKSVSAWVQKA